MPITFLKRYFHERKVFLRVVQELAHFTDRELNELGFSRVDIPRIARQAAQES